MINKLKRGTIREDGKIFFRYSMRNGEYKEYWLSKDKYAKKGTYHTSYFKEYGVVKRENIREYRITHWAKALLSQAKHSAKSRNHPIPEITENWIKNKLIEQNNKCYWLGIDLITTNINNHPQKISLDRLNNNIGYTKGNTVLTSLFANLGRKSTTEELMGEFIKKLQDSILNAFDLNQIK